MRNGPTASRSDRDLLEKNRRFYDQLWAGSHLVGPKRFNTWPLIESLLPGSARRVEVAPGLRPRLPIEATTFVDISEPALNKLGKMGARTVLGEISCLPFADGAFDLVCALDILEHVDDDSGALSELSRIASAGAVALISTPLHPERWTPFDDFVGHKRRYEPVRLMDKLAEHGFVVEKSAVFGMQPQSSRVLDWGLYWLTHNRERALWWYNHLLMPLGLLGQKKLQFQAGMMPTDEVDEVLLVCRIAKNAHARAAA